MYQRYVCQPQTLFDLDQLTDTQSSPKYKTVSKLEDSQKKLVQSKFEISSFFDESSKKMKKVPSIEKLELLYQMPKFSSSTSFSDRLSIKLHEQSSQKLFSFVTYSEFQPSYSFDSQEHLTINTLQSIFDANQHQLILVSMSILLKYLYYSKENLTHKNIFYLLLTSTIIGNKIFYDAQMPTIIKQFSQNLSAQSAKLKSLENKMLKQIQYSFKISKTTTNKLRLYLI